MRQRRHQRLPLERGEVDGHRLFVAVGAEEKGRGAATGVFGVAHKRRAVLARLVARAWMLNLDHLGAQVAQHLPHQRARQDPADVQHPRPFQRIQSSEHRLTLNVFSEHIRS
ncbi:hypothetical protein SDC9_164032 [bioreactor metagenome]|uniref:Uncharacterized protein n=1 Tax=bioreactor metagenome TaxID=1076179 RepID=A0A645FQH9_9ZZZZ